MNLIEQLGGYEKAKQKYSERPFDLAWGDIGDALLQYRRENNIYEVGDLIVINGWNFITPIQEVVDDNWYVAFSDHLLDTNFRHATDAEIAAGRRLEEGRKNKVPPIVNSPPLVKFIG